MTTWNSFFLDLYLPLEAYAIIFAIVVLFSTLFLLSKKVLHVKTRELPPKCLNDPIYGEHRYVQLKNIKLHYVEAGDKRNPLIIFLHGFADFWYSWRNQIKKFSKDFRTVAVDLRGYGDSEKPSGRSAYKTHFFHEDVKNLLESLGEEKCILIGHDWGGVITWNFALNYPEKIFKYVIINAPELGVLMKSIKNSLDQFKRSWYIFFFQVPYLPEMALRYNDLRFFEKVFKSEDGVKFSSDEDVEAYKFTFGKPGALTPPINYYRTLNFAPLYRRSSPREPIAVPSLMIISDNDIALSKDLLVMTAKEVGGENMKTVLMNNAGHFAHQERPEEVNKALYDFLRNDYC